MIIAIDAMGGDFAPDSTLKGAFNALKKYPVDIILTGDKKILCRCAEENAIDINAFTVVDCPVALSFSDSPERVIDEGSSSSIAMGLRLLKDGTADAFLSAGNTGALFLGGAFHLGRIKGVTKAAIGTFVPTVSGKTFVLDSGANIVCTPKDLVCFAKIGTAFLSSFFGKENPEVYLLNNGVEHNKGTALYKQSFELLKDDIAICFAGNIEGVSVPNENADIVVCDGFCGNIFLKTYEGVAKMLLQGVKDIYNKNTLTRASALAVKKHLKTYAMGLTASSIGAAPILGLRKPVFKAHGSSDEIAFENAVKTVMDYCETDVSEKIGEAFFLR